MDEFITTVHYGSASKLMYDVTKRSIDVVAGVGLLTLFSPCLFAAAVAIRCSSRGPIIYKQVRIGRYGQPFWVWKFRTMLPDADQRGPLITAADDARVTRIGRFLRTYKIDELPQLWNVIRGEMSLVGPRPQVPRFVDAFPSHQRDTIMAVRPGITGPTQLKFRNEEKMLEGLENREGYYIEYLLPIKCQMDVDYVRQRSLLLDMSVLCRTGTAVTSSFARRVLPRRSRVRSQSVVELLPTHFGPHENFREEYREEKERAAI